MSGLPNRYLTLAVFSGDCFGAFGRTAGVFCGTGVDDFCGAAFDLSGEDSGLGSFRATSVVLPGGGFLFAKYASYMALAAGAALAEPNPEFSMSTRTESSGLYAGAKLSNHAWSLFLPVSLPTSVT